MVSSMAFGFHIPLLQLAPGAGLGATGWGLMLASLGFDLALVLLVSSPLFLLFRNGNIYPMP